MAVSDGGANLIALLSLATELETPDADEAVTATENIFQRAKTLAADLVTEKQTS